ncbi:hypothetical protein L6164_014837 [Bauhinia variegata]|uniref:Uncharacterized protein n=1 Tax=Bauhinia variegata TaxID=167791 RepID=A0ACB9NIZ0_BAUVA|nr:hypothetical protein L6164_014837 [Bauhinia variegata]
MLDHTYMALLHAGAHRWKSKTNPKDWIHSAVAILSLGCVKRTGQETINRARVLRGIAILGMRNSCKIIKKCQRPKLDLSFCLLISQVLPNALRHPSSAFKGWRILL